MEKKNNLMIPIYKRILHFLWLKFIKTNKNKLNGLSIIIFSKDRPLQLDGLLRSVLENIEGNYQLIIQWNSTSKEFDKAYYEIFENYNNIIYKNIKEKQFKADLINSIEETEFANLMFLVDDILFVNKFNISWLNTINLKKVVPSIRLWPGINYTQPSETYSPPPVIVPFSINPWRLFSWTESNGYWSMPLSVDGNIFDKSEILFLLKKTDFKAPNSLEKAFGPYRFIYKRRKGICLENPVILNFALNRVNTENTDFACGEDYSPEKLLELWNQNQRIDINKMKEIDSNSCHIICTPIFINSKLIKE